MSDKTRRLVGAILGALIGFIYGLSAGLVNSWAMPGVPLRVEAGQVLASAILVGVGALAAGYITAWSRSAFKGVIIGAGTITGFYTLRAIVAQAASLENFIRIVVVLITVFLPALVLALPITGLLRWGVHLYDDAVSYTGRPRWFRVGRLGAGALALGLLAGSFSQMTTAEQAAIKQVNVMVQNGQQAESDNEVPRPLQRIPDFRARALGPYTLDRSLDLSRDSSFADSTATQTIKVDVLFESGLHFECLLGQTLAEPLCTEIQN